MLFEHQLCKSGTLFLPFYFSNVVPRDLDWLHQYWLFSDGLQLGVVVSTVCSRKTFVISGMFGLALCVVFLLQRSSLSLGVELTPSREIAAAVSQHTLIIFSLSVCSIYVSTGEQA